MIQILPLAKPWGGGPPAKRVGGGVLPFGTAPHDAVRDCGWIGEDILCGDTQHFYPLRFEPFGAGLIALRSIAHVVSNTIDLDPESQFQHVEIENISPDRVLAPELDIAGLLPQDLL